MVSDTFLFDIPKLEDAYDTVKILVLEGLIRDNLIDEKKAEKWAQNNTMIIRKKSIFKTLSDRWKNEKTSNNQHTTILVTK